jgi:hypothetical protein
VSDPDLTMRFWCGGESTNFYTVTHLVETITDVDLNGTNDCVTTDSGDSGGAAYQSMPGRPGYVRAMGIITGDGGCWTYYTGLSGVRAWGPSVTVPTA